MVFPRTPVPPPPGLPDVELPPPGMVHPRQTQLDRIEEMLLAVHSRLGMLLEALEDEDEEERPAKTLDTGEVQGGPRDTRKTLD